MIELDLWVLAGLIELALLALIGFARSEGARRRLSLALEHAQHQRADAGETADGPTSQAQQSPAHKPHSKPPSAPPSARFSLWTCPDRPPGGDPGRSSGLAGWKRFTNGHSTPRGGRKSSANKRIGAKISPRGNTGSGGRGECELERAYAMSSASGSGPSSRSSVRSPGSESGCEAWSGPGGSGRSQAGISGKGA